MTTNQTNTGPGPSGAPPEGAVPWARQTTQPQPRATSRARNMVQSLPAWEPLPPGEILVRRQRREDG
jgi:hypothetical protein